MKKKTGFLIIVSALLLMGSYNYVSAKDNNIEYRFELQANSKRSYTDIEYRQTKNPNNKWKVNMTYSSEGKGTKAKYWLNAPYVWGVTEKVSDAHDVKQGSGAHYYNAYDSASETWVNMAAENNNDTSKSYQVSGYWDEETD